MQTTDKIEKALQELRVSYEKVYQRLNAGVKTPHNSSFEEIVATMSANLEAAKQLAEIRADLNKFYLDTITLLNNLCNQLV